MDSLSQIVLGAAVGEAVLGRKIGNRALGLGALAGTIPDLDVLANPFLTEMDALDFHRGVSHSVFFTVLAPLLAATITQWFYGREIHRHKAYRISIGILPLLAVLFLGGVAAYSAASVSNWVALAASLALGLLVAIPLARYIFRAPPEIEAPSWWGWYAFYFWCFATHILLDLFTTYGTQILMPFSNSRFGFNSVFVVDPLYTLPLILSALLVLLIRRKAKLRSWVNTAGLVLSSLYLFITVFNKTFVNDAVRNTLAAKGIRAERFMTTPTPFNSLLWSSTVETDSQYVLGVYSVMDPEARLYRTIEVPKNHQLLAGHESDKHVDILRRFSNGYYTLRPSQGDSTKIEFIDLRWGAIGGMLKQELPLEEQFRIGFILEEENGEYVVTGRFGMEPPGGEEGQSAWERLTDTFSRLPRVIQEVEAEYPGFFRNFWNRIWGRWQ